MHNFNLGRLNIFFSKSSDKWGSKTFLFKDTYLSSKYKRATESVWRERGAYSSKAKLGIWQMSPNHEMRHKILGRWRQIMLSSTPSSDVGRSFVEKEGAEVKIVKKGRGAAIKIEKS